MGKFFANLATIAFCAAVAAQTQSQDKKENTGKYTLFASGDTMLGRWVAHTVYKDGPEQELAELKDMVTNADIAMTNLECVISTRGLFWDKGERCPFLYRARPETLDILTEVGFDLVSTANNHAMDYGPDALMEQLELLDAVGIAQVGTGRNLEEASRPTYIRTGDMIVAFISVEPYFPKFSAQKNAPGTFNVNGDKEIFEAVKPLIEDARLHSDLVVFTPHWGDNWTENTTGDRIELAHKLIDLGVDAILGHSAHHIHGVEIYKGKPIVYDMGSFFFDTVGKKRLRKSAGFLLEFSKKGFTKLTMYPLLLYANRTEFAKESMLTEIKELLFKLTEEIDPKLVLKDTGDSLSVSFEPENPPPPRASEPERVRETGQTKTLPLEYRQRRTNVVLESPPDWIKGFKPVELDGGLVILGSRNSQAAWPQRCFTAEVVLKAPGPFKDGNFTASIKGVNRETGDSFVWQHPIADGGWMPPLWEKDQIVVDRTLVRPPKMEEGRYDLFFRFENLTKKTAAKPVDPANGDKDGYVRIGEILITKKGIPSGAAGVAWHGLLPKSAEPVVDVGVAVNSGKFSLGPWVALFILLGAAGVALIAVIWVRRRRKKAARSEGGLL